MGGTASSRAVSPSTARPIPFLMPSKNRECDCSASMNCFITAPSGILWSVSQSSTIASPQIVRERAAAGAALISLQAEALLHRFGAGLAVDGRHAREPGVDLPRIG